VHTVRRAGN